MDMGDHFCAAFLCFMLLKPAAESKTGLLVQLLAGLTDMVINNAHSVLIISGTSSVVLIALAFSNSLDYRHSTYNSKLLKIQKDWAIRGLTIFYQKIAAQGLAKFTYKWVKSEACGSAKYDVIERVPTYKNLGYSWQLV